MILVRSYPKGVVFNNSVIWCDKVIGKGGMIFCYRDDSLIAIVHHDQVKVEIQGEND